jgi:hypothetical protein
MWLLLTTQLHLLTLFVPSTCASSLYPPVIIAATLASTLWHLTEEQVLWITSLDMALAFAWFLLDLVHAYTYHTWMVWIQVIYLNIVVAAIHRIYEATKNTDRNAYIIQHSLWHVFSAAKCIAVASLLQCPAT